MSQTRDEIMQLRQQRISLLKWKIGSVGAIFLAAFGVLADIPSIQAKYILLGIPPLCLCIDAICADISIRIHFLGRFLESLQGRNSLPEDDLSEAIALEAYLVTHGMTKRGMPVLEELKQSSRAAPLLALSNIREILRQRGFIFFELTSLFWSSIVFNALTITAFGYLNSEPPRLILIPIALSLSIMLVTEFVALHLISSRRAMDRWNAPSKPREATE